MSDSTLETIKHIRYVQYLLHLVIKELLNRARNHDASKLESPEKEIFDEFTPKLKDSTYMSEEYKGFLKEMKVALKHHYAENRHHPEHGKNGIENMNLIDLIEMICDWRAASARHNNNGDMSDSLKASIKRFKIEPQLAKVLENTAFYFSCNG